MDEDSRVFWLIPLIAFAVVVIVIAVELDTRANLPERYIEPAVIILQKTTGLSPYVEFCNPNDDFFPVKLIDNATHRFDHESCVWKIK